MRSDGWSVACNKTSTKLTAKPIRRFSKSCPRVGAHSAPQPRRQCSARSWLRPDPKPARKLPPPQGPSETKAPNWGNRVRRLPRFRAGRAVQAERTGRAARRAAGRRIRHQTTPSSERTAGQTSSRPITAQADRFPSAVRAIQRPRRRRLLSVGRNQARRHQIYSAGRNQRPTPAAALASLQASPPIVTTHFLTSAAASPIPARLLFLGCRAVVARRCR